MKPNESHCATKEPIDYAGPKWFLLLVSVVVLTAGCCTPAVWKGTAAKEWRPIRQAPEVWYWPEQADALVTFKQQDAKGEHGKERVVACWLSSWPELAATRERSVRQLTNSIPTLIRMSVFQTYESEEPQPMSMKHLAVWDTKAGELTIYLEDRVFGPEQLPVTAESRKTAARVFLTPIGVAGDAVIVAAVVTALGLSSGSGFQ